MQHDHLKNIPKNLIEKILAIESTLDEIEQKGITIHPPKERRLVGLLSCPAHEVKVLILGQDPYHGPNQANGLAFSVYDTFRLPPSLKNIFKEMQADIGCTPKSGDLSYLAKQGVALLNTVLSVEEGKPLSHKNLGWQEVVEGYIRVLLQQKKPLAICLWGQQAQKFFSQMKNLVDPIHLVIESNHPSPLSASRGFFGSKPFSKINDYLQQHNLSPIQWCGTDASE
jgi:uracil-DNA glycosylase